jgi:hypothetical protein
MPSPSTASGARAARGRFLQRLAFLAGLVLLVLGGAGAVVLGATGWRCPQWHEHDPSQTLLGLGVHPLATVLRLGLGLAGLALARTLVGARIFGGLLATGYAAVLVVGLLVLDHPTADALAPNQADRWWSAALVIVGLVLALLPVRSPRAAVSPVRRQPAGRPRARRRRRAAPPG